MGQDIDQRDDQNKFSDNSHNDGIFGSAKGDKGHLAGNLDTEHKQTCQIDAQRFCSKCKQCGIGGEHSCKYLREDHDAEPQENGVCQTDLQKKFKGRFDTIHIFGSVVVADDRL